MLRNMVELKIKCGYSQVPVLQSVRVEPSSPTPSPAKIPSHGEGVVEEPTLTLCRTGTFEYSSSTLFLSLSNASANF